MTSLIHENQPIYTYGKTLGESETVVIMLHGRGAGAQGIVPLADEFGLSDTVTYLAPNAYQNTWYPDRFIAPVQNNEPWLTSALNTIDHLIENIQEAGIKQEKIGLLGFSQGACLALEYAIRHPRRYAGVIAFSGGLIGPPGTEWEYPGNLDGTPIFVGCGDVDFHIPVDRVHETALVFEHKGAVVTKKIYAGMGHMVNQDEILHATTLLQQAI